jgi:hypothetical protein|nr:MAG TPA: hypothetical protein [Caudoviricetes sp.]DAP16443.1 MAG TPA: hypothetical protein [Caudoviricetes sp.]
MAKFYTVDKTIKGNDYKAQFNGLSVALRAVDESYIENSNNTSVEKMAQFLFDNVIVEPKGLTVDSFDSMDELNEVIEFARNVMQGELKPAEKGKKD